MAGGKESTPIATCIHLLAADTGSTYRSRPIPGCASPVDGRPFKLEVGQAYEINNKLMHSVANKGTTDRIHFILDYVPADNEPVPAMNP